MIFKNAKTADKSININKSITPTVAFLYAQLMTVFIKSVFNVINVWKHIPCPLSHLSEKIERKETLFHFVRYKTFSFYPRMRHVRSCRWWSGWFPSWWTWSRLQRWSSVCSCGPWRWAKAGCPDQTQKPDIVITPGGALGQQQSLAAWGVLLKYTSTRRHPDMWDV